MLRTPSFAVAALPFAALLVAAPARAELPNKNSDREGWIKASMAGTPASFCGPLAAKDRTGGADPDFVANQVCYGAPLSMAIEAA